ncbi:MAG: hypothetical protein PHV20_07930 [Bacteroidales bacterium]|nr:hypothetical protein [Bacteroidales bacterium]
MSENKTNRREFLTKLGLVIGAATIASTGISSITDKKEEITLTAEQAKFAKMYESWMEDFHKVVKRQKVDPSDVINNKKMVALADNARTWQPELHRHMNDENFVKFHKLISERVTETI